MAVATKKPKTLRVSEKFRDVALSASFYHNTRTIRYADRLGEAGVGTIGELGGKTEKEIRRLARTTDNNWTMFKWALSDYGCHFR